MRNWTPTSAAGGSSGAIAIGVAGGRHAPSNSSMYSEVPRTESPTDPVSGAPASIQRRTAWSSSSLSGAAATGIGLPVISKLPGSVLAESFWKRKLSLGSPGTSRCHELPCDGTSNRLA